MKLSLITKFNQRYLGTDFKFNEICRVTFLGKAIDSKGELGEGFWHNDEDWVVIGLNDGRKAFRGMLKKKLLDICSVNNPEVGKYYRFRSKYKPEKEVNAIVYIEEIVPVKSILPFFF